MAINFQRLMDVAKATELLPLGVFNMESVCLMTYPSCGTAGCMIGNYNAMVGRDRHVFSYAKGTIQFIAAGQCRDWEHFGLTEAEYQWLFGVCAIVRNHDSNKRWLSPIRDLSSVTREQALSRLRTFIYYKLRKNEFIIDEKYGVREEARKAEGNHGFAARAVEESLRAAELAGV